MRYKLGILALHVALIGAVILASSTVTGETDPYIDEVLYSKDSTESKTLVQSGRDNATFYKYLIIDDYSEAPTNWSQSNYNDSAWTLGAAPFGDRSSGGVEPNIIWDTSGSSPYNDDIILIRHKFQVYGIITSAEIDVAVANFCTPYLNGNMIYDDRGGDSRAQEYWNDDAAGTIAPSSFKQGENVLAVYARDYVGGWGSSNRQWIDLQITAQVFEPTNESIIFGDTVTVGITGGNQGNSSLNDFNINITSNGTIVKNIFYETIPAEGYGLSWLEWTPEKIGLNQLNVKVTCNCTDSNLTNNEYTLNLTAVIYSLETTLDENILTINQSRIVTKIIQIENTGDLIDNITLSTDEDMFNNWNVQFTPNNFLIEPNEIQTVIVTAIIPDSYESGYYNLSIKTESQYSNVKTQALLQRGTYGNVDWRWINSTGDEELYDDTNWTKLNFNDSAWKDGNTPFGDDDLGGIDYNTFWDGNNYGYFRHIVNIPDMELYEGGFMTINVATNNYGDHYINGIYVFGDIDGGNGHGAEYWNEEYQVYINYLNEGSNVIASIVSNPTNTQWFDQEIMMTFPQANLWKYKTQTNNIPLYLDATAPTSRVLEEGFYRNSSTFEVKWRSISDFDDLEGYYIYYLEKDGSNLGDWTLLGFYENESLNFTGEGGLTYRFKSIAIDTNGNIEYKGTYDTEMRIDLELPKSTLWIVEENLEYTNLDGVTLQWKANDTIDIQAYLIEYKIIGNDTWNDFGAFTSPGEYWFSPEGDAQYEIRSRTVDYAGNIELKEISDVIITFDRMKPQLILNSVEKLTGSSELIISIKSTSENLSNIELEYARLSEGTEDVLNWIPIESGWVNDEILVSPLIDGYTYYFRAKPIDLAGNEYSRDPYQYTLFINANYTEKIELDVLPLKPIMIGKIRNIEITVDEDGDGIFEKTLEEYTGIDLSAMKANQYWVDYDEGEVILGDGQDGYQPPKNSTINLIYKAFDLETTIDETPPEAVQTIEYAIEERNNVTITWERPTDATSFTIESKDNFSMPWEALGTVYTNNTNTLNYKLTNLTSGFHYYRIVSVDRMGYSNPNMKDEHIRIIIEAEVNEVFEAETKTNDYYLEEIAIGVVLCSIAIYGTSYLIRGKPDFRIKEEIIPDGPILIPVNTPGEENRNLDADEEENAFSVVSGSQFSRQLLFLCDKGCMKEFEVDEDDVMGTSKEIMCPYCGTLGDSPL